MDLHRFGRRQVYLIAAVMVIGLILWAMGYGPHNP